MDRAYGKLPQRIARFGSEGVSRVRVNKPVNERGLHLPRPFIPFPGSFIARVEGAERFLIFLARRSDPGGDPAGDGCCRRVTEDHRHPVSFQF